MKSVSADCPHHEACTAAQVLTSQGEKGAKWGRREAKKKPSRVKWCCAGFGNQRNFERSTVVAGLASCWRNRQPQSPCLDRTGVSRILMSTRGKEREREEGGTYWKMRQKTYQKRNSEAVTKPRKDWKEEMLWVQGGMSHKSHETGYHLSEHPAMLWRAHKDPVCPQRRQRQTRYSRFFFLLIFFLTAMITPHTQHDE